MSRVRFLSGLSAALALGLAACGGDTTSTGDPLTEAEAAELAEALGESFVGFGTYGGAAAMGAPGEAAATITITLNETQPCEPQASATVTVVGSMTVNVNEQTGAGTFGFNYTLAPHGCQVTTSGGKVFTLNGDPNIKVAGDFNWTQTTTQTSAEGQLTYDGQFTWEASDGRAGACGVDLTANYDFNFSSTGSSGSATLTGSVCGVTVNRTISVEA